MSISNFGLGNRTIPDDFEVTLPSGRKTDFTRAKTDFIRHVQKMNRTDFANSPVEWQNQINMLNNLATLATREGFKGELEWIDAHKAELETKIQEDEQRRIEQEKILAKQREEQAKLLAKQRAEAKAEAERQAIEKQKQVVENTINFYAAAYYQPFFADSTPGEQKAEMLNPKSDLMQLLNSCKISDTQFDPNAEVILKAYQGKTKDVYHLGYLINNCRNESDGKVNPMLAQAVSVIADRGVDCSKAHQFLVENTSYDYETETLHVDFAPLEEISEFKEKLINDVDILKYQRFLANGFEDREKIKSFIFELKDANIVGDEAIEILDVLKRNIDGNKYDIQEETIKNILNLKRSFSLTRKNEVEERKLIASFSPIQSIQLDENTLLVKTPSGFVEEHITDEPPEEIKKQYEQAMNSTENAVLVKFLTKYVGRDGLIDNKHMRVFSFLRNNGVVYDSILPLMELSFDQDKKISQTNLDLIKFLKENDVISSNIYGLMKTAPKNEDGICDKEFINSYVQLASVGYKHNSISDLLSEIKISPEIEDFYVVCGQIFKNKEYVFKLLPLTKDKEGNIDENSLDMLLKLGTNLFERSPKVDEQKRFEFIVHLLKKMKEPSTNKVSDEAVGICSILDRNGYKIGDFKKVLEACQEKPGVYDENLSEIVWQMSLQKAKISEIVNVLSTCRAEDKTILTDKVKEILEQFSQGCKKEDIVAKYEKK